MGLFIQKNIPLTKQENSNILSLKSIIMNNDQFYVLHRKENSMKSVTKNLLQIYRHTFKNWQRRLLFKVDST